MVGRSPNVRRKVCSNRVVPQQQPTSVRFYVSFFTHHVFQRGASFFARVIKGWKERKLFFISKVLSHTEREWKKKSCEVQCADLTLYEAWQTSPAMNKKMRPSWETCTTKCTPRMPSYHIKQNGNIVEDALRMLNLPIHLGLTAIFNCCLNKRKKILYDSTAIKWNCHGDFKWPQWPNVPHC